MAEIDFANDEWNQDERLAYILYQFDGSQAVIDAVNRGKIRHDKWATCDGCDAELPFLNDECLACGGEKKVVRFSNTWLQMLKQNIFVCEDCGSNNVCRWVDGREVEIRDRDGESWCDDCEAETKVITADEYFALDFAEQTQGEIFDGVNDGSIEHDGWGYCKGCECESPHVNNVCLVCGQGVKDGEKKEN